MIALFFEGAFFGATASALAALIFAHRALVASMIRWRPSALIVRFFGAAASTLAALIAAQRLFCPSAILRRLAALNLFFLGAGATFTVDLTQSGMVGSS